MHVTCGNWLSDWAVPVWPDGDSYAAPGSAASLVHMTGKEHRESEPRP